MRLIAAIAVAVVLVDLASKEIALRHVSATGDTEILGGLVGLELYRNFAGPNGILSGHTTLISVFAILASIVLIGVAYRVRSRLSAVAVGLLLGGAIGNLVDRLFREPEPLRGGVVDWFRLTEMTNLMNLADIAINAGVALILVGAALAWWRERREDEGPPPGESGSGASLAP